MIDRPVTSAQEVMMKWTDLVISQASDVWTVALTFFAACVLVLAGLHGQNSAASSPGDKQNLSSMQTFVMFSLIYISAVSSASSLFFAYMTKGALIGMQEKAIETGTWEFAESAEVDSLFQFGLFAIALVSFVAAFVMFRRTIGSAIISVFRGE